MLSSEEFILAQQLKMSILHQKSYPVTASEIVKMERGWFVPLI